MLGRALSGKNVSKKKKKKKKDRSKKVKERGGLDPSGSPSSSGEGSSSDSYETDEGIDKWEEDSDSSRSRKLEPPSQVTAETGLSAKDAGRSCPGATGSDGKGEPGERRGIAWIQRRGFELGPTSRS